MIKAFVFCSRRWLALLGICVLCAGAPVGSLHAQNLPGNIPADAREAKMTVVEGQVYLNGKLAALTPGAIIRNTDNLIVMSTALNGNYLVRVQADLSGAPHRIWIIR